MERCPPPAVEISHEWERGEITMHSLIMCDLDGTLIDSREDLARAVNSMRAHYGFPALSTGIVAGHVGDGARTLVERSLSGEMNAPPLEEALALMKKNYADHLMEETILYPGVKEGLESLIASGRKLAVVTNKPLPLTLPILDFLGIRDYFVIIMGGDMGIALKPDPAFLLKAVEEAGAERSESWIIGDHFTDLEAGRRAGVSRCFAAYGFGQKKGEASDLEVHCFGEFVAHLKGLHSSVVL
jgi:phosphoglycolate phosphatase